MDMTTIRLPDLKFEPVAIEKITAKTELRFGAVEKDGTIAIKVTYITALFKRETIEEMAAHYIEILKQVVKNNEVKLKDIEIARSATHWGAATLTID